LKSYERARAVFEQLRAAHPDVPDYQHGLAQTYNNLGVLQGTTRQPAAALKSYERARAVFEQLRAAHPDVPDYQHGLAQTYTNLGAVQSATGQSAAALKSYERAREVFEQLRAAHPEVPAYQIDLAGTYVNLGALQRDTGRPQEGLAWYAKAIALLQAMRQREPNNPKARQFLRNGHWGRAQSLAALGRYREALADWDRALELDDGTDRLAIQIELAGTYVNLGNLQRDIGRPQDGLAGYAKAIALLGAVRQREPQNPTARQFLRNSHLGRAQSLTALGRYREALADWDRALELDTGPKRQAIRIDRAAALAHTGQHDRAMAEVQDLAQGKALTPGDLYNVACIASLAADSARQDSRLSPPTREKLAEQNALRAIELLKQAHAAGYFKDPAHVQLLKTDKDLDPLRARADFQQLAAAVGKAGKK
jgi:tetratricopeptide (TPR) repeat protein